MTMILTITNQKGGVGKSTSTFHFARAAFLMGLRVLCVDSDPQGNLTSSLAPQVTEDEAGLADALSNRSKLTLKDVIVPSIWEGVHVVPTVGDALGFVRDELVIAGAGRESRLKEGLDAVKDAYDLVLIDSAPSLDQLTINGLVAGDSVLIVTQSKLWSANGLARLLKTISEVRTHYNKALTISGILINQHESNTSSGSHWLDELHAAGNSQGIAVLAPPIPKRVVISDAHESGSGLDEMPVQGAQELAELYAEHLTTLVKGK